MSDNIDTLFDDLNRIVHRAFPQGAGLLEKEGGLVILRLGARPLIDSPTYALQVLGPRATRALGKALVALGEQHQANGERMQELAAEAKVRAEGAPVKASSGAALQPTNTDSIKKGGGDA
jgi:hypothetical protein